MQTCILHQSEAIKMSDRRRPHLADDGEVMDHVRVQNGRDNHLADVLPESRIVWDVGEDVCIWDRRYQGIEARDVAVLQNAAVVVGQRKRVTCGNQEVVVHSCRETATDIKFRPSPMFLVYHS